VVEALLRALLAQTVALTLAVVAVRGLQALLLRRLGAEASYLAWLLVPVAMLAALLPHPAARALVLHVDVAAIAPAWAIPAPTARAGGQGQVARLLAAAWLAGAVLLAALLAWRQRRFEAALMREPGAAACLPAGAGPAVLGVLRPRIALPRDFESAFDGEERRLMLLHEHVHLRRRDNLWNLLASTLLVLHWFNPLAWWAARGLRADQELACDAAVLRREQPAALAAYAGALLKVQGVALAPPVATAWRSSHPLVERIRMLQHHRLSPARHRAGLRLAALSIVIAGVGGYAVRSNAGAPGTDAVSIMTAIELKRADGDGHEATIAAKLLSREGRKVAVRFDSPTVKPTVSEPVEIGLIVKRLASRQLQMDVTLQHGNPLVELGSPRVITIDGTPARVEVTDKGSVYALTLLPRVVESPPPVPPVDALPPVPPTSASPPLPAAPPVTAPLPPSVPPPPQRAL
jgi:beta-lactamase regulating signal transducer with metallopeptidase domain